MFDIVPVAPINLLLLMILWTPELLITPQFRKYHIIDNIKKLKLDIPKNLSKSSDNQKQSNSKCN